MFTAIQETNLLAKIKKKDLNAILDWFESRKSKYYRIGWLI
ncbi:hypothetical protein [Caldalkalibacillus mannanilyticus]|nr:hypothetical protein [Caldalkalibacillus mannanilyticus]